MRQTSCLRQHPFCSWKRSYNGTIRISNNQKQAQKIIISSVIKYPTKHLLRHGVLSTQLLTLTSEAEKRSNTCFPSTGLIYRTPVAMCLPQCISTGGCTPLQNSPHIVG